MKDDALELIADILQDLNLRISVTESDSEGRSYGEYDRCRKMIDDLRKLLPPA